jgi:hypothetical protein
VGLLIGAENTFIRPSNHQFAGPLTVERRSASHSRSLHVTPIMQRPQAKQAIVKSTAQSAHSSRQMSIVDSKNHYGSVDQNLNGIPDSQRSYRNNSISSLLKTSVANNSANNHIRILHFLLTVYGYVVCLHRSAFQETQCNPRQHGCHGNFGS